MAFLCLISPAVGLQSALSTGRSSSDQSDHDRRRSILAAAAHEHSLSQRYDHGEWSVGLVADRAATVCEAQLDGVPYLACLSGTISNASALLQTHGSRISQLTQKPLTQGLLLIWLYHLHGSQCVYELLGSFCCIIVKPHQVGQVFAASSQRATQPLIGATMNDSSAVYATGHTLLPPDTQSGQQIPPGHFKQGDSPIQRFASQLNSAANVFSSATALRAAPVSPFVGMQNAQPLPGKGSQSIPASTPSSSSSMHFSINTADDNDEAVTPSSGSLQESVSYKKTRRGKRAGKNLHARNVESELRNTAADYRRGSADLRRTSIDSQMSTSTASDMDWRRSSTSVGASSVPIPTTPRRPVSPHRPNHNLSWNFTRPSQPQGPNLGRQSLPFGGRSEAQPIQRGNLSRRSLDVPRRSSELRPRGEISGRTPGGTYVTPSGSYRTPVGSLESMSHGMHTSTQASPRSLRDPSSMPPSSPLVSHDGKADAAWGEEAGHQERKARSLAKKVAITPRRKQPGFELDKDFTEAPAASGITQTEDKAWEALNGQGEASPFGGAIITPRQKQHGYNTLAPLPEHDPARLSGEHSASLSLGGDTPRSGSPFTPRDLNVQNDRSPTKTASPERMPARTSLRSAHSPSRHASPRSASPRTSENVNPAVGGRASARLTQPSGLSGDSAPVAQLQGSPGKQRKSLLQGLLKETQYSRFASHPNLHSLAGEHTQSETAQGSSRRGAPSNTEVETPVEPPATIGVASVSDGMADAGPDSRMTHLQSVLTRLRVPSTVIQMEDRFAASKSKSCNDLAILAAPVYQQPAS